MRAPFTVCTITCAALVLGACTDSAETPPSVAATEAPAPLPLAEADANAARESITGDELMPHIEMLASNAFRGRAPMSEGERVTLAYLEDRFRHFGLEPMFGDSFRQAVPLVSIEADPDTALTVRSADGETAAEYAYGPEVMMWTAREVEATRLDDSELVWVGYGIVAPEYGWNDYAGLDVRGKTVVMLVNDPGFATGDPELFNGRSMTYYGRWTYKYEEAARQGAAGAFIIHETEPAAYGWNVVEDSNRGPQFHLAGEDGNRDRIAVEGWMQYEVARDILAAAGEDLEQLKTQAAHGPVTPLALGLTASTEIRNTLARAESYNIGAVVRGGGAPDELFLYMAHWDHLGIAPHEPGAEGDFIYNGAEDNASGVAGLLELAEAFAGLPQPPRRSVGFLAVTAEESGLIGSRAYAEDPAWALQRTAGGLNMDRLNFIGPMNDVVVIGYGSSEMEDVLRDAAQRYGRSLTPEATPEKGFFYRSDHFNFARKGVPVLYARGGTEHRTRGRDYVTQKNAEYVAERYHAPSDEIQDDWDLQAAEEDLRLFFDVGLAVADGDAWPNWYEGNEFRAIRDASMTSKAD